MHHARGKHGESQDQGERGGEKTIYQTIGLELGKNAIAPFASVQSRAAGCQVKELGPRDVRWEEEALLGRHQGVVGASRRV
jgi:hypothetical protein